MDATENGAKQGERFRLKYSRVLQFEKMTREQYRRLGEMKALQIYKTKEKQQEFVYGWITVNQSFFRLMADGPRRRVTVAQITIICDKCGADEKVELSSEEDVSDFVRKYKDKPCPECQKADRCVSDEFDDDFEKAE